MIAQYVHHSITNFATKLCLKPCSNFNIRMPFLTKTLQTSGLNKIQLFSVPDRVDTHHITLLQWLILLQNHDTSPVLHRDTIEKQPSQRVVRGYWWEPINAGHLSGDEEPNLWVGWKEPLSFRTLRYIYWSSMARLHYAPIPRTGPGSTNQPSEKRNHSLSLK